MLIEAALSFVLVANKPDPMGLATPEERRFAQCVKAHESGGRYGVTNGHGQSSSAGAYQFITSTWRGNAKWSKWQGTFPARPYARAHHAPAWIQDLVFLHALRNGGMHAWRGTGCTFRGVTA